MSNQTIDLLMDHRSIRKYEKKPVSAETVQTILRCAQMAPTSSYLQAYSIIEVTDPAKREVLKTISGGQKWVVEAPLALLFCADLHRCERFLPIQDKNVLHNHELFTVAVADAALAAQKAFIAAQAKATLRPFLEHIISRKRCVYKTKFFASCFSQLLKRNYY